MTKQAVAGLGLIAFVMGPLAGSAGADLIIRPVAATSSTTIGGTRTIAATISGIDLSEGGNSDDVLSETHLLNTANNTQYWLSGNEAGTPPYTEVLVYDLGGAWDVNAFHLWSYDRGGDNPTRAIKNVDLSFSTDGGVTYGNKILGTDLDDFLMPGAVGRVNNRIPVQSRTFDLVSGVTHIKLDNIVNWGNAYIGISEVRFGGPAPAAGTVIVIR